MACNTQGLFAFNASSSTNLCYSARTITLYSGQFSGNFLVGDTMFTDPFCTVPATVNAFYSNGVLTIQLNSVSEIRSIVDCPCDVASFCVHNDPSYNDTYAIGGLYNNKGYYSGVTSGNFMYYSSGETRWCLSSSLGGSCVQFGPYGSISNCPDFDDTVMYNGACVTTTTTTDPCATFNFDAIFDCLVPESPTPTPSNTPTPTPTPSPSPSNPCGGRGMSVTSSGYTPTPTPTMTPTPTPSPQVTRPCNFSGEVIFNAFSEYMQCANSKKFKDCFTGIDYYTSGVVLVSGTTAPKENYVYNAVINGQGYCVIYEGLYENISGVDNITLTSEVGSYLNGACLDCLPNLTQTPTPTPTSTPTPTPSPSPCVSYEYRITNQSPAPVKFDYIGCSGSESQNVPAYSASIVCASVTPTTTSPNIQIESLGSICI
jgi:hypothetical protein